MRRISALALVLLIGPALAGAPEKWYEAYNRGVSAVNAKSYRAGADALQKAVAEMPNEGTGVRAGSSIIVYVPHFWLGIAKFNLGDVDGALREWRISEEQGVISRTEYYARMKDWVARAQTEKQRNAQSAASGPKKQADTEISKALAMQVDALSAGGDRSESYRAAQRKLQEALAQFNKSGTDVAGYAAAEATAREASSLFSAAAEEGKKQRAARQAAPPTPKPQPQRVLITNVPQVATQTAPPPPPKVDTAPPVPVESESEVAARVAVQAYRRAIADAPRGVARTDARDGERLRRELEGAKSDADFDRIAIDAKTRAAALAKRIADAAAPPIQAAVETIAPAPPQLAPDLGGAFRAYAAGDLAASEQELTRILDAQPAAEAFALRGCVKYTRAMLSRTPALLLNAAAADFKAALQRDRALRLDKAAFSPKLVAFFEQVKHTAR